MSVDLEPGTPNWALIVGGGTAGHVLPGVAIGRELVHRGHPAEAIHWVGSERGVESRLVPDAGFELTMLPGRGIQRRLTTANIGATIGLLRAFAESAGIVNRRKPRVVIALGGYASVPAGLWAALRRVPIVVAEQNAVPGLANRIIGRFAKACAVSYPDTDLPRATWTGNPVREAILDVAAREPARRAAARSELGVAADQQLVVIFGGSLGARTINNAVLDALPALADRDDVVIRHIIGSRDHADVVRRAGDRSDGRLQWIPIEYEDDMASVLLAADLVVCRAGATSCAELAATGTPALLVPLPGAPGDHQTENARALQRVGGAELVPDGELDGTRLADEVSRLLSNPKALADMGEAARSVARPDAAAAVADLVEAHAKATP